MRQVLTTVMRASAAALLLSLACCGPKRTGPDSNASPEAPDIASPVPVAAADPGAVRALIDFTGADSNHDGKISSAEYAAATARMFGAIDAADDGTITAAEMEAAQVALKLPAAGQSAQIIAAADNDGDGKLTLAEFIARSNSRFVEMDKNADGQLDPNEWTLGHPGFPAAPGATVKPTRPPPSVPTPALPAPPTGKPAGGR